MQATPTKKPILKVDNSILPATATCDNGRNYIRILPQGKTECEICGEIVTCGWHCLDNRSTYGFNCVVDIRTVGDAIRYHDSLIGYQVRRKDS